MKKIFDNIEDAICALTLVIMTFITVINVISRKFLGLSMSFLEEITLIMFILASLIGSAAVAREGGHLGLNLFTDMLPKKYQKYVALVGWAAAAFFSTILTIYGFQMVKREYLMGVKTAALGWPEWTFGIVIPLSAIMIFIRYTQWVIDMFKQSKEVE